MAGSLVPHLSPLQAGAGSDYPKHLLRSICTGLSNGKGLRLMPQLTSVPAAWCRQTMAVSEGASSPGVAMHPSPTYWSCGLGCQRVRPRPLHT